MNIEFAKSFLLWCTIINYAVLLIWVLFFMFAKNWMRQIHARWFKLNNEQFDAIHYGGIAFYKIIIFMFNLTPLIALYIMKI